jgi:hypothetical protein
MKRWDCRGGALGTAGRYCTPESDLIRGSLAAGMRFAFFAAGHPRGLLFDLRNQWK